MAINIIVDEGERTFTIADEKIDRSFHILGVSLNFSQKIHQENQRCKTTKNRPGGPTFNSHVRKGVEAVGKRSLRPEGPARI